MDSCYSFCNSFSIYTLLLPLTLLFYFELQILPISTFFLPIVYMCAIHVDFDFSFYPYLYHQRCTKHVLCRYISIRIHFLVENFSLSVFLLLLYFFVKAVSLNEPRLGVIKSLYIAHRGLIYWIFNVIFFFNLLTFLDSTLKLSYMCISCILY